MSVKAVQAIYSSYSELEAYHAMYRIANRLNYAHPWALWMDNPFVVVTTVHDELRIIRGTEAFRVLTYDNGGKTFDQYTAVFVGRGFYTSTEWALKRFTLMTMSTRPNHNQGVLNLTEVVLPSFDHSVMKTFGRSIDMHELPEGCRFALMDSVTKSMKEANTRN